MCPGQVTVQIFSWHSTDKGTWVNNVFDLFCQIQCLLSLNFSSWPPHVFHVKGNLHSLRKYNISPVWIWVVFVWPLKDLSWLDPNCLRLFQPSPRLWIQLLAWFDCYCVRPAWYITVWMQNIILGFWYSYDNWEASLTNSCSHGHKNWTYVFTPLYAHARKDGIWNNITACLFS